MPPRAQRTELAPLRIGDVFLGKYQILELAGSGGHGCVYGAQSLFMGREVAIKVLDRARGMTDEARARGQREAVALGRLGRHPGIVEVYDAGIDPEGRLYIVMERLEGRTLHQHLREHGPLGVEAGLRLLISLCDALEFARQAKVVHRDIKPTNIFITPDGSPKLVDFGVAKITDAPGFQTAPQVIVGTALYVSPEQIRAQPATHRSDLYGLGLVAYQLFSGEHPLLLAAPEADRRDLRVIWALHLQADPPRLDQVVSGFPEYVARLVHTAMSREPAKRYATAAEFGKRARETLARYENDRALEVARLSSPASSPSEDAGAPLTPEHAAAPDRIARVNGPELGTPTPVQSVGERTRERSVGTPVTEQFLPPTPSEPSGEPAFPSGQPGAEFWRALVTPAAPHPGAAAEAPRTWPRLVESSLWTPPSAPHSATARSRTSGARSAWSAPLLVLCIGAASSWGLLRAWPSSRPVTPAARQGEPAVAAPLKRLEVAIVESAASAAPAVLPAAPLTPPVPALSPPQSPPPARRRPPVPRLIQKPSVPAEADVPPLPGASPAGEPVHWADFTTPADGPTVSPREQGVAKAGPPPEPWLD